MRSEISHKQLALAAFLLPMVFKTAMLPMMLAEEAGRDAYIAVLPLLILDGVQLVLLYFFLSAGGIDMLNQKLPTVAKYMLSVTVVIIMGVKSSVMLAEAVNYVSSFLFYNVPDGSIFIIFAIALGFIGMRGAGGMGKMCEIGIWIFPMILVLGFIFGDVDLEIGSVLPVLGEGVGKVFGGSAKYLFWSCDFLPLMYMSFKDRPKRAPLYLLGFVAAFVLVVGIYIIFIANYGESAKLIKYAFATLSAFNTVTTEIGSLEWTGSAMWITMATVYLSSFAYGAGAALGQIGLPRQVSVGVFAGIIGIIGAIFMGNHEKVCNFATCGVQYLVCGLEILLPAVALCVVKSKAKERAKGGAELEAVG